METTPIDHPADLGQLIRTTRKHKKLRQLHLARSARCSTRALSELELGLLSSFPVVTLELLRDRLELDPIEMDAYTGALWRNPPRCGTHDLGCCGLRTCVERH